MLQAKRLLLAVCAFAFLLFVIHAEYLVYGETCPSSNITEKTDSNDEADKKNCPTLGGVFYSEARFFAYTIGSIISRNINELSAAVTAAATAVIAIYTLALWRATSGMLRVTTHQHVESLRAIAAAEKSAHAAEMSAKAAIGVELPRFSIQRVDLVCDPEATFLTSLRRPRIDVKMSNQGRTEAYVQRQCVEVVVSQTLPRVLEYPSAYDFAAWSVIRRERPHLASSNKTPGEIPEETIRDLFAHRNTLWVYGYVFYWDFLDRPNWFKFRAHMQFPVDDIPMDREPRFILDSQGRSDRLH